MAARLGPFTPLQLLERMRRLPRKGSRAHKRRHRAFLLFQAEADGRHLTQFYRRARKILPLP